MVENGQETGDSALGLTARADVLKELELSGCAVGGDPAGPWAVEERVVGGRHRGIGALLEAWAARGAIGFLGVLPEFLLAPALSGLARLARHLDRRRTQAATVFLKQALGEARDSREARARVIASWRHLFRLAADAAAFDRRLLGRPLGDHFRVRASDAARAVLEAGNGCLLVSAHLGDWEAALPALAGLGFAPLYAVGKPPQNHYLALHLQALRERRGMRLLPRRGSMADVPKVVRAGGTVVLLLDQRAVRRPVLAPFFGRPARCDRSAGVLLRRLSVPVVLFSCLRGSAPGQYELDLTHVIHPEDVAGLDPTAVATLLNGHLERMILARPDQYFWLHDRYRDTSAGS
jgi:KDO2-lipid IV(A) lauroyltransferase